MKKVRLIDLHNDAVTSMSVQQFEEYVKQSENAGLEAVLVSVWTTETKNPLEQIQHCRKIIDRTQTSAKLFLHIEDAWFINGSNIDQLIECKPFSVGLTWNTNNNLAGGAEADGNLTSFGEMVIEKLTANNIFIDLAHLNRASFWQVAEFLVLRGRRLFCTHTCFDEVSPHKRNLDRRQIQTIVDSGGLVGLTLVGDFLCHNGSAAVNDVYNHIAYFIKNFGDENLAIGTDFYGTENLPKGLNKYSDFKRFEKFLISKGLSDVCIDKIFYRNAKRFFVSYNSP